jgi:hypothetical protein
VVETSTSLGEDTPISPYIHTTIGMNLGQPFLGVSNPLWGQPNQTCIPLQGSFPFQFVNPMIPI